MPKITVIGAGQTGATTAHWIAERGLADTVLVDVVEGMPQGKALDLSQAMPIIGSDSHVLGTNSYAETAGSDIVIITAGLPRKPGMSRDELLEVNSKIVREAVERSLEVSPQTILIVLTNPLDAMAYLAMKVGGLPRERVIGQAGILDSARMRAFVPGLASVQNVHRYVLGGHGDEMVPLTLTNVAGVPGSTVPADRLAAIVDRTRKGGGEIVGLLKTGSASTPHRRHWRRWPSHPAKPASGRAGVGAAPGGVRSERHLLRRPRAAGPDGPGEDRRVSANAR
jgi:malate dehydrogenase